MLFSLEVVLIEGFILSFAVFGIAVTIRILDFPDLTFDGSIVLGSAVTATLLSKGFNFTIAILIATLAGCLAGFMTAFFHCKLKISKLLSGIISMTVLFTINLRIMGSANVSLLRIDTIFSRFSKPAYIILFLTFVSIILLLLMMLFLSSKVGLTLRGVGMNEYLISSLGFNKHLYIFIGLGLANSLVAFSGSLLSQFHKYSDISDGIGAIMTALAALVIGESIIPYKHIRSYLISPLLGSIVFQMVIMFSLKLGLPTSDLKLLTGVLLIFILVLKYGKDAEKIFRSNW